MLDLDRYTKSRIEQTLSALSGLTIYSGIKTDPVLTELRGILLAIVSAQTDDAGIPHAASKSTLPYELTEKYSLIYSLLLRDKLSDVPDLGEYVLALVQNDDNLFTRAASGRGTGTETNDLKISPEMRLCVINDLMRIETIASFPSRVLTSVLAPVTAIPLPEWRHNPADQSPVTLFESLLTYHREKSFGVFSKYHAFIWKSNSLEPVERPDPIRLDQLFEYEYEISQVLENTRRLIRHKHADNLLLFGARGTGKSSAVKAVANACMDQGLRLIEVDKDELLTIADLLAYLSELSGVGLSFILFLDDLSFAEEDTRYTILKTLLEGGVKIRPDHVAIYATSNRRHLVAEKESKELYANDASDEKLSLSDRFGISIRFQSPNQQTYLQIVYGILKDRGVTFEEEVVSGKALSWAMRENGRSPRSARQFADYYEATCENTSVPSTVKE